MVNNQLDSSFGALAHPIRRRILERLADGSGTVGETTSTFAVSKPAISKHLRVLEDAGLVERVVEGRTHRLSLGLKALEEPGSWIARQRALWERKFDVVDEYLLEQRSQAKPSKEPT